MPTDTDHRLRFLPGWSMDARPPLAAKVQGCVGHIGGCKEDREEENWR